MQTRHGELPLYHIDLPQPRAGNKIFCTQQHGVFILEKGPTIWRCMSNTHSGTGGIYIYDGVPLDDPTKPGYGFFPDDDIPENDPRYATANGRLVFAAMPAVLGMWMEDGGLQHGLTLVMVGENASVAPCVSICWLPDKVPAKRMIVEDDRPTTPEPEPTKPTPASRKGKR
jgi:hypothetical protein